ncbi:hypothetical protein [Sulfurovum mangrovi]|uniref:hypothetical protein n=1 Tax=Sulfurovum mangrovi TaxID=2893889 RepID=UPI001E39C18D|nr:hypothetical protein [Sulfurovum mangrovi]UFH58808.1 hypothetical protein LN246_10710 [Sulfurovum mangrovi]
MKSLGGSKKGFFAIIAMALVGLSTGVMAAKSMPVVDNADDLCYGEIMEQPLDNIPYFHKRTVPIINQSGEDLSEVGLIFATNALLDIVPLDPEFDCGIDDISRIASGECVYEDTESLGKLGLELDWLIDTTILHDALRYEMPDYVPYESHSIYHKHGDLVDLSGVQIYATYIKDNVLHRGRLESCNPSSNLPFQNEYTCGTFPSVLTSYEHMSLMKNTVFNSCTISYPENEFTQGHNIAPTCYTDLTSAQLCQDVDEIEANGNCNFVPPPTNRYDHDFLETTDSSTLAAMQNTELTKLEYGNYIFTGNKQEIHFNPTRTYSNSDKKVMLLGDVTLSGNSQVLIFEEGDYYFRSLDIQMNSFQIEPRGNVRIFIKNDLNYAKNSAAWADPSASLFFYVGGDLTLSSEGGGDGYISAFFYVKGDVLIQGNSHSEIYGGITAEGRIDVTGNNFEFKYNADGANQFGLGECALCYDPPRGPNGLNFYHLLSLCSPLTPCDIYVPVKNISPIPLDDVQVFEAKKSLLGIGLGSNHEVLDKEGNEVTGSSTYKSRALYADLPLGLDIGLLNGYVNYNIGDGYPTYAPDEIYYELHKKSFISGEILDFSQLIYFGQYTDDIDRHYNIRLDPCKITERPPSYQTGPFDAWDIFRGDTDHDGKFDDKNISTKIAGKTFSLTIANLDAELTSLEAKSISSTVTYGLYNGDTPIDGTLDTFDIKTTLDINKTYTNVMTASRNVHVGFVFCSEFDGTTYTLLESTECSGGIVNCKDTDSNPKWRRCFSSDEFAIRPKSFLLTPPDGEDIELLASGATHRFTIIANNEADAQTNGYDQVYVSADDQQEENLTLMQRLLFKDGSVDTNNTLHGTLGFNDNNFEFVNGISTSRTNPAETQSVGISFSDVGRVQILLQDTQWANLDSDDTPQSCNGGALTNEKGTLLDIPDGAYICGDQNATFIPAYFDVTGITLRDHNNEGNFTYLSNDLNMSAQVGATIVARNTQGAITENFREGAGFYENPVSVTLGITDWNASSQNRHPLNNDVNSRAIPNEVLLGFGGADEANGTHTISDAGKSLIFNYQRNNNQPVNPFRVPGSDINISVSSTYTSSTKNQSVVTGNGVGGEDSSATFHFGRAKASKEFYDLKGTTANTPVAVYVYCNTAEKSYTWCDDHHIDVLFGTTDLNNWWLSRDHNEALGDGNIMLQGSPEVALGSGSATVSSNLTLVNGQDTTVTVQHNSGSLPVTYNIQLETGNTAATPSAPVTDSWLVYNPDSLLLDPDPFYKVRFTGDSGWAGVGDTGHVLDFNASTIDAKRLNW